MADLTNRSGANKILLNGATVTGLSRWGSNSKNYYDTDSQTTLSGAEVVGDRARLLINRLGDDGSTLTTSNLKMHLRNGLFQLEQAITVAGNNNITELQGGELVLLNCDLVLDVPTTNIANNNAFQIEAGQFLHLINTWILKHPNTKSMTVQIASDAGFDRTVPALDFETGEPTGSNYSFAIQGGGISGVTINVPYNIPLYKFDFSQAGKRFSGDKYYQLRINAVADAAILSFILAGANLTQSGNGSTTDSITVSGNNALAGISTQNTGHGDRTLFAVDCHLNAENSMLPISSRNDNFYVQMAQSMRPRLLNEGTLTAVADGMLRVFDTSRVLLKVPAGATSLEPTFDPLATGSNAATNGGELINPLGYFHLDGNRTRILVADGTPLFSYSNLTANALAIRPFVFISYTDSLTSGHTDYDFLTGDAVAADNATLPDRLSPTGLPASFNDIPTQTDAAIQGVAKADVAAVATTLNDTYRKVKAHVYDNRLNFSSIYNAANGRYSCALIHGALDTFVDNQTNLGCTAIAVAVGSEYTSSQDSGALTHETSTGHLTLRPATRYHSVALRSMAQLRINGAVIEADTELQGATITGVPSTIASGVTLIGSFTVPNAATIGGTLTGTGSGITFGSTVTFEINARLTTAPNASTTTYTVPEALTDAVLFGSNGRPASWTRAIAALPRTIRPAGTIDQLRAAGGRMTYRIGTAAPITVEIGSSTTLDQLTISTDTADTATYTVYYQPDSALAATYRYGYEQWQPSTAESTTVAPTQIASVLLQTMGQSDLDAVAITAGGIEGTGDDAVAVYTITSAATTYTGEQCQALAIKISNTPNFLQMVAWRGLDAQEANLPIAFNLATATALKLGTIKLLSSSGQKLLAGLTGFVSENLTGAAAPQVAPAAINNSLVALSAVGSQLAEQLVDTDAKLDQINAKTDKLSVAVDSSPVTLSKTTEQT